MPLNTFSTGRDVTLTIVTAQGPLNLNLITGFHSSPVTGQVKVKGLDGITRHALFPDGWTGGFDVERSDGVVGDYFAQLEEAYYSGQNIPGSTITETISEPNGGVTQYRYTQVLFQLDDAGSWAGDQTVKLKISFMAARRRKIA
jgi:hypothetical protein